MKNKYEIRGDITAIFINSPKYGFIEALISTSKLQKANEFPNTWTIQIRTKSRQLYAAGQFPRDKGRQELVLLHRFITDAPIGKVVDHINHDTLNNTDKNLRIISNAENQQNRKGASSNSSSGIRGVYWHGRLKKWYGQIRVNGKKYGTGFFVDRDDAEREVIKVRKVVMPYTSENSA